MKTTMIFKIIFLYTITLICVNVNAAHDNGTWIDYNNNTQLILSNDGTFKFSNAVSVIQGSYSVQNNILMMQDSNGNYSQYNVLSYSPENMVLSDQNGVNYSYVLSLTSKLNQSTKYVINSPWENPQFNTLLTSSEGLQWHERENQIYIEFLQFLIAQPVTAGEINAIREDFIKQFEQRPEDFIKEVKGIEETMRKIYSLKNMQKVALVREEISTAFNALVKQQPQMNDYAFVQTLNKYVRILSFDNNSNLSLSNQDVEGYINYLQFQAMLMGQDYLLSQQDRITLQFWLTKEFNNYATEQKQSLAFAGFIWNNLAMQWAGMNTIQQQQYILHVQSLLKAQNVNVNSQTASDFWNNSGNYDYGLSNTMDYTVIAEANYAQRMRETDNMIFTAIQNNMTENHVTMMNMFNSDSDYEYVVDYGNDY